MLIRTMRSDERQQAQPTARERGSVRRLWFYGLGMAAVFWAFAWRYPLLGYHHKLIDIGQISEYRQMAFIGYVAGIVGLFSYAILALIETRRLAASRALPAIFGCALLMIGAMVWMYPVNAIDIFLYAVRSRLWTSYGTNPLSAHPADYPADPWHSFAMWEWAERGSPYGPLWNLLAAPVTWLAGEHMLVALLGFKLLAALGLLAGGWVIWLTLRAWGRSDAASGVLFYLWNPLLLWEGVGNGHNDVLLLLPVLLALYAWATRRDQLVLPLLVAAVLIKYVTAPLIPVALVALWQRAETGRARWQLLCWSALGSLLVVGIALFPFYDLGAVITSITQQGTVVHTSPAAVARVLLGAQLGEPTIAAAMLLLGGGAVVLTMAWYLGILSWNPEHLPRACFELLYIIPLLALANLRPWYLIWPLGLAALLGWGWPQWRMLAWTAGGLLSYAFFIWIEAWWQPGYALTQIVGVTLMLGGTVALSLAEASTQRLGLMRRSGAPASR